MYTYAQTLMQRRQSTGSIIAAASTKRRQQVLPQHATFDDLVKALLHNVQPSAIASDAQANNLFLFKNDSQVELKQLQDLPDHDSGSNNNNNNYETSATLQIAATATTTPSALEQRHICMSSDGNYCAIALGSDVYLFENLVENIDKTQIKQRFKVNCNEKIGPNSIIHQLLVTSSENGKRLVELVLLLLGLLYLFSFILFVYIFNT